VSERLEIQRAQVTVTAHAPGHAFRCTGTGVSGHVELDGDAVVGLEARFPLAELRAGDPLGNRELKKFLGLDRRPFATARLVRRAELRREGDGRLSGRLPLRFEIEGRGLEVEVEVEGRVPSGRVRFRVPMTGFGLTPPKLLFMKVQDVLDVEVEVGTRPPVVV
jgi:predicted pyridoxine 5'-phosphate oxidase superfamily flavin-nucleotide-binding protein